MTRHSAAVWVILAGLPALGQPNPAPPAFEVASVKPSNPDARGSTYQFPAGGGVIIKNGTLKGMIESAYDVREFQIAGASGWMDSAHYDIFAKRASGGDGAPAANTPERNQQTRLMLQTLLAQRFQLKVRRETREVPMYALTVGKKGAKLADAEPPSVGIQTVCGKMTGTSTTMANLAAMLSRQLSNPVKDQTGLSGRYNFELRWAPDAGSCTAPADGAGALPDGPSIFTAIQEQLGLKLESIKGPVEIVVVDHAGKPDAN